MAQTFSFGITLKTDGQGAVTASIDSVKQSLQKLDDSATTASVALGKTQAGLVQVGESAASTTANLSKTRAGLQSISEQLASAKEFVIGLGGLTAALAAMRSFRDSIIDAQVSIDKLNATFGFATGGAEGARRELAYVSTIAQQLGLDLRGTADAYSKFSAAARGTALEGAQTRAVFESVAKASTVMGLSADETKGALLALQQMISKGNVQAEELRGQLGERIPGAFQIAARAMGVTTAELGKMLEQGQVLATDFLPKFAAQMERELAGSVEKASTSMQASLNRAGNAWQEFWKTLAASGVGDFFKHLTDQSTRAVASMTDALRQTEVAGGGFLDFVSQVNERGGKAATLMNIAAGNWAGALRASARGSASPEDAQANDRRLQEEAIARNMEAQAAIVAKIASLKEGISAELREEAGLSVNINGELVKQIPALEKQLEVLRAMGASEKERLFTQRAIAQVAEVEQRLKFKPGELLEMSKTEAVQMDSRSPMGKAAVTRGIVEELEKSTNNIIGIRKKFGEQLEQLNRKMLNGGLSEPQREALKQEMVLAEREQERAIKNLTKPLGGANAAAQLAREQEQTLNALAALRKTVTQAGLEQEKVMLGERLAILEQEKLMGLVSTQDYIEKKYALKAEAVNREIALAQKAADEEKAAYEAKVAARAGKTGVAGENAEQAMLKQEERMIRANTELAKVKAQQASNERDKTKETVALIEKERAGLQASADVMTAKVEKAEEMLRLTEETMAATARSYDEEVTAIKFEAELIGKSAEAQARLRKEREIALEMSKTQVQIDAILARRVDRGDGLQVAPSDEARYAELEARLAGLKKAAAEVPQAVADATQLKAAAEAWQNTSNTIREGLTTALEDWVMRGKSLGASLRDQLKQMFNSLVLRPVIQAVSAGVTGMLGLGGGGAQASPLGAVSSIFGGGGGGGGVGGLLNSASSLFGGGAGLLPSLVQGAGSLFGGAFSSLSATTAAFVDSGMTYAAALSSAGSAVGGFAGTLGSLVGGMAAPFSTLGTAMSSGIAAAGGFASVLGAAVPIIGGLFVLASAMGAFDNKNGLWFDFGSRADGSTAAQQRAAKDPNRTFTTAQGVTVALQGEGNLADAKPFVAQFQSLATSFADLFGKELNDKARAKLDDWTGFSSRGRGTEYEGKDQYLAALNTESKDVMAEYFSRLFSVVDTQISQTISAWSGSTEALATYIQRIMAAKTAIDKISAAVPEFTTSLGAFLNYSDAQQQALLQSVDAFIALHETLPGLKLSLEGLAFATKEQSQTLVSLSDTWRVAMLSLKTSFTDAMANVGRTDWSRLFAARGELLQAAQSFDGSALAAQKLAAMSAARYQAEVAMLQRIAGLIVEINAQFRDDVTSILDAGRTKEQNFEQNRNRADASARALKDPATLTAEDKTLLGNELGLDANTDFADPEVIAKLAAYGRKAINEAFAAVMAGIDDGSITEAGMTKEALRAKYAGIYAGKQAELGNVATGSLTDSGTKLAEGGDALNKMIRDAIEKPINEAAAKMNEAADKMVEAAKTMNDAAKTPKEVVVTVDNSGGGGGGSDPGRTDQVTYYDRP